MLLLYITSDNNMGMLDNPCKERSILIKQKNGDINLQQFIIEDMSNLSCCQYLAIDLSCLSDNDDSIINALVGIQSMYNFKIIILASGYYAYNPLLGRIFAEGIYNIITATRQVQIQEQLELCLDNGMQYKDAIRYRLQDDYVPNQTKGRKHQQSKVIVQKQSIKQTISIGVSGTIHRIGTTKQALHIAKFLNDNHYRACYIQNNDHKHIEEMTSFYEVTEYDNFFSFLGVDIFPSFEMGSILSGGYDFVVYDNGLFEQSNQQKFLEYDFKIITAGALSWEAKHINPIFERLGNYNDIHFIFSFVHKEMYQDIQTNMGKFKKRTHFAEYAPADIDGITNAKLYKKIFNEYIHEKQITQPAKKGLWRK